MADDQKRALQLELKKRYVEAADLWLSLGQIDKALYNYQRGGKIKKAIDIALGKGLTKKAADLYVKAEIYDRAAELYRKERDYVNAARAYRSGGRIVEAAAMFESAGEFSQAARLHESVGDFLKAGELYEKGSDLQNSARVYELAVDEKGVAGIDGKRDLARVAEVLTKVKNFEKAAELYVNSEEVSEAILMFVRMGEVEGAAKLLSGCQGDIGFEVLAHIDYTDRVTAVEFARMFYLARDFQKAARVFEACQEHGKAAMLFEKCQDYQHAGEAYAAAKDNLRAAAMFEKSGSFADAANLYLRADQKERAASCFEQAHEYYDAGRLYYEIDRHEHAIDVLQKVDESSSRALDASLLIAKLLRAKGYLEMAVDRYQRVIQDQKCDAGNLEHFYDLGCILLERGELSEAERLLSDVAGCNFGFADVAQRLEQVRAMRAAPSPSGGRAGRRRRTAECRRVGIAWTTRRGWFHGR